jgi:hypothetical protein
MRWPFSSPPIEIFIRHCHFSAISQHKSRFATFSRERCFENFVKTLGKAKANVTLLLDTYHPMEGEHFVKAQRRFPVVEISEGTETGSFLKLLEYVLALKLKPETIVYFLEDDYFHRPGWVEVLLEGFSLNADYVTLYDHRDKYFLPCYEELQSKIAHTDSCHWRETPSTTNTYAMRFETLLKHLDTHRAFSLGRTITADHEKFCALAKMGAKLISPMPGWSTHAEPKYASPCVDWEKVIK